MTNKKFYVTMTDRFLSGWGQAEGKISKYIIICDTFAEAQKAAQRAEERSEMKYINICFKKPYYNSSRYHTSYVTLDEAPFFK